MPGHQIQVDVKFLKFAGKDGKPAKRYQYTAIDDATRIRALKIYDRHTQANAIAFIDHVIARFPFRIREVRTDNVLCREAALGFGQQVSSRRQIADVGSKLIQMVSTVNGIAPSHSKHRIQRH